MTKAKVIIYTAIHLNAKPERPLAFVILVRIYLKLYFQSKGFKYMPSTHLYFLYILTNYNRTVLYTGITNNLEQRIIEHYIGTANTFTTKYNVYYLLYYESSRFINNIIAREKEIKLWVRAKKEALINSFNPEWKFLNEELFGEWPPKEKIDKRM